MWNWITFTLLAILLTIVCLRNIILKIMIIKTYNEKQKRNIYKQIIKKEFPIFDKIKIQNWDYKVKSNLWATQIKVFFTIKLNDKNQEVILGTLIFSNRNNKNKDLLENLNGIVFGNHARYWI